VQSLDAEQNLAGLLSSPRGTEAVRDAVTRLIAERSSQESLERLYPTLIRHKTLTIALDHLEEAGADLDSLFIPGWMFRSTWPFSLVFAATRETTLDRVSLAVIRGLAERHEELLGRLEEQLLDHDEGFVLLFSRALRAAFPDYRHGTSHDVDIFIPPGMPIVPWIEHMCARMGFFVKRLSSSRVGERRLAQFKLYKVSPEGHYLSVDIICSGRPARGLEAPFVPELWARVTPAARRDRVFWVPCREDMLLMLTEKTHRRADFIRRHFNDVELILSENGKLDWPYLVESARRHELGPTLHVLLRTVGETSKEIEIPDRALADLAPTEMQARLLTSVMSVASRPRRSPAPHGRSRRRLAVWRTYWFARHAARLWRRPGAALQLAGNVIRSALLAKRFKRVNTAVARRVGELGATATLPLRAALVVDFRERGNRLAAMAGGRQSGEGPPIRR